MPLLTVTLNLTLAYQRKSLPWLALQVEVLWLI